VVSGGRELARVDLWRGRAVVVARLGRVGVHAHSAGALLIGLDGRFGVRAPGRGGWGELGQAYVPLGLAHELDCGATTMAVIYAAPGSSDERQFIDRWRLPTGGPSPLPAAALVEAEAARRQLVSPASGAQLSATVDELLGGPAPIQLSQDPRVEALVDGVIRDPLRPLRVASVASELGLSATRLRHLVRARVGLSLQALRRWQRMREVGRLVGEGASLTEAAHHAGFSDSAQLSRDFRATFGIPPSRVFAPGCEVRVHG